LINVIPADAKIQALFASIGYRLYPIGTCGREVKNAGMTKYLNRI